jgi:2-succinyl-6-hydroxy-2,4-cyclohexadiene-1-carboxylate synthase
MGGRVALHLALAHPSLVSHLVLCSTTAGIDDPDERAKRLSTDAALAGRIREIGLEVFLDEWRAQPMFANLARTTHDDDARMVNTVEGLAGSLGVMGTGTQQPLWSRLNELKMPVLIVTGNKDAKFDSLGRRLRDTIGDNAHHISVPDAGHAVPFERPAEFAAILDRFLR